MKLEFFENDEDDKNVKMPSRLTVNGFHKSYGNYDSYTFNRNEVFMDELKNLGFAVLELTELLLYESFYDELQPYFGQDMIPL